MMMKQGTGSDDRENPQDQKLKAPNSQPPQKCPRCESLNTKFCYYNNYSLSQPRYFCKTCRRYWTQGGTLRNVPVGGGCRKGKRARTSPSTSASCGQSQLITAAAAAAATNPPDNSQITQTQSVQTHVSGGVDLGVINVNKGENFVGSYANYPSCGGGFLSYLNYPQGLVTNQGLNQPLSGDLVAGGSSNLGLLQNYINYVNLNPAFGTVQQVQEEEQVHEHDQEQQFYQLESLDHKISTTSVINTPVLFPSTTRANSSASSGSHYVDYRPQGWTQDRSFINILGMNDQDKISTHNTRTVGHSNNNINTIESQALNPDQWTDHHHHQHLPGYGPPS